MSRFLKILLFVFAALMLLLAGSVTVFAMSFDPNDYKERIEEQVLQATGRQLTLSGPLSLSVFPWLGITAEGVSLANAEGFTDPVFAQIGRFEARVKLLPLLSRRVEIGKLLIDEVTLNLERRADGSTNWDDLGPQETADDSAPQGPDAEQTPVDLTVAGVELRNASLRWRDGEAVSLVEGLNLSTGPIQEDVDSTVLMNVVLTLADQTRLALELDADWRVSAQGPALALPRVELRLDASGDAIPAGSQSVAMRLAADYSGAESSARIRDGQIEYAGQRVNFEGVIEGLQAAQNADFKLDASQVNVAAMARELALELPAQAGQWPLLKLSLDAQAELGAGRVPKAQLDAEFGELKLKTQSGLTDLTAPAGSGSLQIAPLDLHAFLSALGYPLAAEKSAGPSDLDLRWTLAAGKLDVPALKGRLAGEPISGRLSVQQQTPTPVIRANLDLAGLTLADWAGQGETSPGAGKKPGAGDLNKIEVPLDWARDLNLTARAAISRLDAYGVKLRNVLWTADARPGKPVAQRLSANAYGGELALNNTIDANRPEPLLGLNLSAKAVGLGDLLKDGWGSRWITGTTELGLNLATQGRTVGALRSGANGDANYRLKDGELQGFSLNDVVRKASAALGGGLSTEGGDVTRFSELAGQALIESGRLKMQSLGGGNSWFRFDGQGVVDLLAGTYDLQLKPVLLANTQTSQDKVLSRLVGQVIPIGITGPLMAPKLSLDLGTLLKERARAELQQSVDKEKDKLRDKIEDKLGDKLGDFLKPRATPAPSPQP